MIVIRRITQENKQDLYLKNEPFEMPGKLIPALEDGVWSYRVEPAPKVETMTFPDEPYDFDEIIKDGAIFGAYDNDVCVGIAIYKDAFFKYMYLYDLKVNTASRGRGIGRMLIEAGMEEAKNRNYRGLYLQAQDNNVNACLFYLKTGFRIGGFDNRVYTGTSQEDKADIIFYKD